MANEPRSYFSIKEQNEPSLDTWVPSTNFLQLGFRPGYSLQARELIEIQSIIQNQISTFAQELGYSHGSLAKICETDPRWYSFELSDTGVRTATVAINPGYIFMKDSNRLGYFVRYNPSYADGSPFLHSVEWSTSGSADNLTKFAFIGVDYTEATKVPEQDPDLYDNAAGFPNYNAPGAVRYHIDIRSDMRVKEVLLPITWPDTGEDTGEFDAAVNAAVVSDHDEHFAASKFIPLFYWASPEPDVLKILHSNKQEYEEAFDAAGDAFLDQDDNALYKNIIPINLQLANVNDGPYESCGT